MFLKVINMNYTYFQILQRYYKDKSFLKISKYHSPGIVLTQSNAYIILYMWANAELIEIFL